jgi:hypothetical protein
MLQTKRHHHHHYSKKDPEKSSNPMAWAVGNPEALQVYACLLATDNLP